MHGRIVSIHRVYLPVVPVYNRVVCGTALFVYRNYGIGRGGNRPSDFRRRYDRSQLVFPVIRLDSNHEYHIHRLDILSGLYSVHLQHLVGATDVYDDSSGFFQVLYVIDLGMSRAGYDVLLLYSGRADGIMQNGYRGQHMYLYDCENGIGYAGFEKTSIFSMNQKKGSDFRLYCKMEPNRGGRFFNTPGSIRCQAVSFIRVEGDDCLDQPDGSNGEQVLGVFLQVLIFFDHMGDEPQITFDQDVLCIEVSLCISLDVILLFRSGERTGK